MKTKLTKSYGSQRFILGFYQAGEYEVCADHLQEALDFLIDTWEENNKHAFFLIDDEIKEYEKDGTLEDYISGGNHGRYTSFQAYEVSLISEEPNPNCNFEKETN